MQRLYFDVMTPTGTRKDQDGRDLPDMSAARVAAVELAGRIVRDENLSGDLAGWVVEVRAADGDVCARQPFATADAEGDSPPPAGPHARADLMNPDATPGTGSLPPVDGEDESVMSPTG